MTNTNDLGDARSKTGSNFFLDLMSPQAGTVVEKFVYKGQYVQEGDKMFTISDSSELWFQFEIYEHQLPWIHVGQSIKVTAAGLPGRIFDCKVTFIHPVIDPLTRTVHVRGGVENPMIEINGHSQRLLRFGMYAEGRLQSQSEKCLAVPKSAVLFPSDDQAYVFLDNGQGVYHQRQIKLGRQGDEMWEVTNGLEEGDRVVTSGNVLVDAQSQFNDSGSFKPTKLEEPKPSSKDMDFQPDTDAVSRMNETNISLIQAVTANSPRAPTNSMGRTSRLPKASAARTSELPPLSEPLSEAQLKASNEFFDRVGLLSLSLAEDNLTKFNSAYAVLREHGDDLAGKFQPPHPWSQLILNLKVLAGAGAAKDIIEARRRFLIFSTNAAEFAKRIRKEDPTAKLKVFHCPMAPKPGLWVQTSGPLQNPYFGAEMLSCGEEVKP
jgi:Cu(I)/Ag(I) efflux system membrane fusion protein